MARRSAGPIGPGRATAGAEPTDGAPRERLTRGRVVAAALAIVDRDGLGQLTMRSLGRELGVDPMAAYHWFPNKLAILQGVGEAVIAEVRVPAPDPGAGWPDVARAMANDYRAVLLRHPNALPVASTQPVMTPRGFGFIEGILAALTFAGLCPGAAMELINTVSAFVIGSSVVEAGVTPGSEPLRQEDVLAVYAGIDPAEFPMMTAAMAESASLMADDEAQFEAGVTALLRGLEASFRERGLLG
jgi:TetR/AcrR family transcriptional regulator, tetracycline repressor protein